MAYAAKGLYEVGQSKMGVCHTDRELGREEGNSEREEMGRKRSQERSQEEFTDAAGEMHERLWSWRREEAGASFDEIMERVRQSGKR